MDEPLRNLLQELERFGREHDAQAATRHDKMRNVAPQTGELLAILVLATKAKRVLEIGTSNGYSTLWLADAARAVGGLVVTVEVFAPRAEMARQNLARAGLSSWVRQEVTDAGDYLRRQPPAGVDLLFLDSERGQYVSWWPDVRRALAPGGLLVVDNATSHPQELEGFVALVKAAGWRSLVLPVGNGELVALAPLGP